MPYIGYFETDIHAIGQTIRSRVVPVLREKSSVPQANEGVHGILGMNVLQQCWQDLLSSSHKPHLTKIPWPTQDPIWQRALKTTGKTLEFGAKDGKVGKAYLGGQSVVLSARQVAIVKAEGHQGPGGNAYEAVLEPTASRGTPMGVAIPSCLVKVESGSFSLTLYNETNSDVIIPKSAELGTLCLGSVVHDCEKEANDSPSVIIGNISAEKTDAEGNQVDIGSGITPHQKSRVTALLEKHQDTFSRHAQDVGYTDTIVHHIDTGTAHPVRQRHRPLPPSQYKAVRDHIHSLMEEGIVRESGSPWAYPVVVVQKKDSSIRLCVDFRRLNQLTHRDSFPLPRIEESLQALGGAKFFSVLDLTSGYYQVAVHPNDVEKTAFAVPFGLYEYTRLPFGLSNAPATFQRLMQRCLGEQCFDNVLIYLDDIIVYSPDFDTHLTHLDGVFTNLRNHGLKLKPVKCHLLKTEVQYLGRRVSSSGVAVDPQKIKVVREWPEPASVKDVRAFLGFTGFFRHFIQGYASIAGPLFRYLKGDQKQKRRNTKPINGPINLAEAGKQAFHRLVDCVTTSPILSYADFSKLFRVETDASATGLGAILFQQDDDDNSHVIAYASRTLRPAERSDRYSAFKLELLAVKWAITEVFKDYLVCNKCVVVTDHHPLLFIDKANLGCTEMKWMQQLSSFDYELCYG